VEALDVGRTRKKNVKVLSGVKHEYTDEMREEMFLSCGGGTNYSAGEEEHAVNRGIVVKSCDLRL